MALGSSAGALARALLALSRTGASGVLSVDAPGRRARLTVEAGAPRALALVGGAGGDSLGDRLMAAGAIDERAHERALSAAALPAGPIGDWLVAHGVVAQRALEAAMAEQLVDRVAELLAWESAELQFERAPVHDAVSAASDVASMSTVLVRAIRRASSDADPRAVQARLGPGVLRLTRLGDELLVGAALSPLEARMIAVLRRGASASFLIASAEGDAAAVQLLDGLARTRAAAEPVAEGDGYGLLLRKQREVRRGASPHALLDLPRGARGPEARRALRRLVQRVHPDRFDAHAPTAVHDASREVMIALLAAERRLTNEG